MKGRREGRKEGEVEGGPRACERGCGPQPHRASPGSDESQAAAMILITPWTQPDPAHFRLQKMPQGGLWSEPRFGPGNRLRCRVLG